MKTEEEKGSISHYAGWRMEFKGCSVSLIALYYPSYTHTSPIKNMVFLDDFTMFAAKSMVKYNNIIILGDISLHIHDPDNPDAYISLTP